MRYGGLQASDVSIHANLGVSVSGVERENSSHSLLHWLVGKFGSRCISRWIGQIAPAGMPKGVRHGECADQEKEIVRRGSGEEPARIKARHRPDPCDQRQDEACHDIRAQFPGTQVIILTSHAGEGFVEQALHAGAAGYVLKQVGNEELVRAVRAAQRGEIALDPRTATRVVARLKNLQTQAETSAFRDLSQRELDLLALVAKGESNREIGQMLNLSEITVRNYVSNILEKLHLRNRIELATYAVQHRIEGHLEKAE